MHARIRPSALHTLFHGVLPVGHRRDLRQMRHAEHLLPRLCHSPELFGNLLCRPSADARVDLVEDQRRDRVLLRQHILHRQHDPRQLAAGRDLCHRPERLAHVGRHQEPHKVKPCLLRLLLLKLTLELHLRHVQLRKFCLDALLKLNRSPLARLAQRKPRLLDFLVLFRQLRPQPLDFIACKFDLVELALRLLQKRQHVLHARAIFPLQLVQHIEPLLDLLQLLRRIRQLVAHIPRFLRRVLRGVDKLRHLLVQRCHIVRHTLHARERLFRLRQQRRRAVAVLVAVERRCRGFQRVRELFGILQQLPPRLQFLVLTRTQLRAFDLADLIFQCLHQPRLLCLVHIEPVDLAPQRLRLRKRCAIRLQQRLVVRERIQIDQMVRLVEQPLRIMLPMDVNELQAEPPQQCHRHGPPVHAAAVLPIREDLALHQQRLRVIVHAVLRKPRQFRHAVEYRTDEGFRRTSPDDLARRPFAENRRDRVDHDGFTRAGLAGQHV